MTPNQEDKGRVQGVEEPGEFLREMLCPGEEDEWGKVPPMMALRLEAAGRALEGAAAVQRVSHASLMVSQFIELVGPAINLPENYRVGLSTACEELIEAAQMHLDAARSCGRRK